MRCCKAVLHSLLVLSGMFVSQGHASVTGTKVPFSAEAIQQMPGEETHNTRIFVAADRVRMEYSRNGNRLVEIVDLDAGRSYLLLPSQREYILHEAPAHLRELGKSTSLQANPCAANPQAQCDRLGEEQVSGRDAVKWQMVVEADGRPMRSLIWIDKQRKLPLRQLWPDGTVVEMSRQGQERLDGRQTEKWQMQLMRSDGETLTSQQWYDLELQIIIREQLPGGYSRGLRNIEVGEQPPELFQVPSDYQRVTPPRNPQSQSQGGMQR